MTSAALRLDTAVTPAQLLVSGDWTLAHYSQLTRDVARMRPQLDGTTRVQLAELQGLDTSGAALLADLLGAERLIDLAASEPSLTPARQALLNSVGSALREYCQPEKPKARTGLADVLAHIGDFVASLWARVAALLGFIGLVLETLIGGLFRPRRWRVTSLVANIEQTGLDAVPIVVLLTFMVGAVVAFLGATVLANFGATIYTVNLVAFAFLREFGVLLTAILMAGRTASAFTAQIGSMKANEEVDAIRTLGLNPIELLVLPRVLALLVSLPILTFLAMLSGILGGAVVCLLVLNISPTMYLTILQTIEVKHLLVGLCKAPLFAFLIAVIGCLEGFKVSGSAQSVGEHTTSAVVQSIFVVILLDALAAMFFMEMGW
ncbi:ABC transporter permease [Pseudomonas sp. GV071]|jgi:phospholipid/cholesterol/gamma-HCH transport system permease protein|uniref:MlaE family ABC transporter permease n=1 Tax=Pseudomonas sp. GV071 TaxID=2135754 RepID=UPI000D3AC693|nr:ABC transporter permease [Pseudomonas sp. GV071]